MRNLLLVLAVAFLLLVGIGSNKSYGAQKMVFDRAQAVESQDGVYPVNQPSVSVALPDDWALTRPNFSGVVWYRIIFDRPNEILTDELLAIYIERVCINLEVMLNGQTIHKGGRMQEPITRNCHASQFMTVPSAMLKPSHNFLDIKVVGHQLGSVSSRQHTGGLSALLLGTPDELAYHYQSKRFWGTSWERATSMIVVVLGGLLIILSLLGRRDNSLMYLGLFNIAWALLNAALAWHTPPLDTLRYELLLASAAPLVGAFAVQFLLSLCGQRSKGVEFVLLMQCLIIPVALALGSPDYLFVVARFSYTLIACEMMVAMGVCLALFKRNKKKRWGVLFVLFWVGALVMAIELYAQYTSSGLLPGLYIVGLLPGLFLIALFLMVLLTLTKDLEIAEQSLIGVELAAQTSIAMMKKNYFQMADERVEQVAQAERKRIAGDLHDDLGAKLLTIVHTSESDRISSLAREALEEMRLSVKGLTGRPMLLLDALADWRAEAVLRLEQAGIQTNWTHPDQDCDKALSARIYVQTTRILRETVSNIIKHSRASLCTAHCEFNEIEFSLAIQDNGIGIGADQLDQLHNSPGELQGMQKSLLDSGHGLANIKQRAKQLNAQCVFESANGCGTIVRLTIAFDAAP